MRGKVLGTFREELVIASNFTFPVPGVPILQYRMHGSWGRVGRPLYFVCSVCRYPPPSLEDCVKYGWLDFDRVRACHGLPHFLVFPDGRALQLLDPAVHGSAATYGISEPPADLRPHETIAISFVGAPTETIRDAVEQIMAALHHAYGPRPQEIYADDFFAAKPQQRRAYSRAARANKRSRRSRRKK